MLNLIEMFSQRPAPIVGARFVRGRDMVCGVEVFRDGKDAFRQSAEKTRQIMLRRKEARKRRIVELLKTGSFATRPIAERLGYSETNTGVLVRELFDDGKIVREKIGLTFFYKAKNET